jgi:tetratricopeptide (TPR) repeat protein
VGVKCLGNLKMPVPVAAYFEDGTSETKFTDLLLDINVLKFKSEAELKEVRLDPKGVLALVVPPPLPSEQQVSREIQELPWTGAGEKALNVFNKAKESKLSNADRWFKLGLTLYDGKYYTEALEAFSRSQGAAAKNSMDDFVALVWQGHILDIFGRRKEALDKYKEALKKAKHFEMRHDQYGIKINREWVEERLKKPFRRNESQDDARTAAESNLEVLEIKFEPIHQGKDNVVRVKVKNTSSQEQTFGIHIQTKSPKYRGRFSGWGRPFFYNLKAKEMKWTRFEFEIFGPITDATWIRLQFYNPASADEFDFEKWFKKIMYSYKDFERFGIDEEPLKAASKDHFLQMTTNERSFPTTLKLLSK